MSCPRPQSAKRGMNGMFFLLINIQEIQIQNKDKMACHLQELKQVKSSWKVSLTTSIINELQMYSLCL